MSKSTLEFRVMDDDTDETDSEITPLYDDDDLE